MSLLVVEIVLALVALRRGWRIAPLLLVVLPIAALAFGSAAAPLLAPRVGPYFEPAGAANALAHGLSLVGLGVACWTRPAERPTASRAPGRPASRRTGSLYQI
jgi:hypothetical protein